LAWYFNKLNKAGALERALIQQITNFSHKFNNC
jgi:hypothetical protein